MKERLTSFLEFLNFSGKPSKTKLMKEYSERRVFTIYLADLSV